MKTNSLLNVVLLASLITMTGCFSHNFPKDAYIQGAHSKIVTPWGTSELVVDKAATGQAAKNVSLPDGLPSGPINTTGNELSRK